ncbi:MAG: hypothetical protein H0W02_10205 [Ktedonobacteraceae bacterium]|nr:hypothetical protein [Ktedonobacteraceae bacterium]
MFHLQAQDLAIMCIIALGIIAPIPIKHIVRLSQMWRYILIVFLIVSDAAIAETVSQATYPSTLAGTMFTRAFLILSLSFIVYMRLVDRLEHIDHQK